MTGERPYSVWRVRPWSRAADDAESFLHLTIAGLAVRRRAIVFAARHGHPRVALRLLWGTTRSVCRAAIWASTTIVLRLLAEVSHA